MTLPLAKLAASIGRRECQSPGVYYRTDTLHDGKFTLYCLDFDDFTRCVTGAKPETNCCLCRANERHSESLHAHLLFIPYDEQQKLYGETGT